MKQINQTNLDVHLMEAIISALVHKAVKEAEEFPLCQATQRRAKAFDKAGLEIARGTPFALSATEDGSVEHFVVGSASTPWTMYFPGYAICQCKAFQSGEKMCWHRAAYEILSVYASVEVKQAALLSELSKHGIKVIVRSKELLEIGNQAKEAGLDDAIINRLMRGIENGQTQSFEVETSNKNPLQIMDEVNEGLRTFFEKLPAKQAKKAEEEERAKLGDYADKTLAAKAG